MSVIFDLQITRYINEVIGVRSDWLTINGDDLHLIILNRIDKKKQFSDEFRNDFKLT